MTIFQSKAYNGSNEILIKPRKNRTQTNHNQCPFKHLLSLSFYIHIFDQLIPSYLWLVQALLTTERTWNMELLQTSFQKFAVHGDTKASGKELNGKNWAKLCKDCGIIDGKNVTSTDVDIVFSKVKWVSSVFRFKYLVWVREVLPLLFTGALGGQTNFWVV